MGRLEFLGVGGIECHRSNQPTLCLVSEKGIDTKIGHSQIRHLKPLHRPIPLQPVGEVERVVHLIPLEDVQPAVQQDLPAVIRHDMPRVDRRALVVLPREVDPCGLRPLLRLRQILRLLLALELVLRGDEMDLNLILVRLLPPIVSSNSIRLRTWKNIRTYGSVTTMRVAPLR